MCGRIFHGDDVHVRVHLHVLRHVRDLLVLMLMFFAFNKSLFLSKADSSDSVLSLSFIALAIFLATGSKLSPVYKNKSDFPISTICFDLDHMYVDLRL